MIPRAIAAVWGLAVTAVLILVPLSVRDRLPDPMATHWGASGSTPDGSNSFTGYLLTVAIIWVVLWPAMLAVSTRKVSRRPYRASYWGCLFGLGVLLLGANAATLLANLDAPDWRAAAMPDWHIPAVLAVAVVTGALAAYLGRGARDEPSPESPAPPRLRLGPGQRAVWVSRVVNRWLTAVVLGSLAVNVVTVVWLSSGGMTGAVAAGILPVFVLVLLVGLATMSITVRVRDDEVAIGFGPVAWPRRRIRLSKIDAAWAEDRRPRDVGGWGVRGLPGSSTIMLRGGECLVLRYRSGGQIAISIDDAERGASLINTLIAERVTS
ncbi:hypothetical protein [Nonomuraea insulae]|uniref:DUF1648 domain-containing protein n=1 Tax=Nonomuraea insulae TaxID=1616787 RepID=A0ABW1D423_9ACTN